MEPSPPVISLKESLLSPSFENYSSRIPSLQKCSFGSFYWFCLNFSNIEIIALFTLLGSETGVVQESGWWGILNIHQCRSSSPVLIDWYNEPGIFSCDKQLYILPFSHIHSVTHSVPLSLRQISEICFGIPLSSYTSVNSTWIFM